MKKIVKSGIISLSVATAIALSGCGGGGSTPPPASPPQGTTKALSLPSKIEVIKANDDNSRSLRSSFMRGYSAPLNSDYANDTAQFWVSDDSTSSLNTVNMIMSFIDQTNYEEFVNKGPYSAMVKDNEDNAGSSDQSKGASKDKSEKLLEFVVDVKRTSNSSPMIVNGWLDEEEDGETQHISFKIEVTQGVSTEYPAGKFIMHIVGKDDNGNVLMKDILKIDKSSDTNFPVSVKYKDEMHDSHGTFIEEANLLAKANFSEGKAYTKSTCWNDTTHHEDICEYKIAYNSDYVKVKNATKNDEYFLDKNHYTYKIYNYGLYDKSTGNKPTGLNAGMHIMATIDGKVQHGYAGYWGVWLGEGTDLSNATITDDDGNEYSVFESPGQLKKHTKHTITLNELDGVEMNMNSNGTDIIIVWDKNTQKFKKIATQTWGNNGPNRVDVAPADLDSNSIHEYDSAWCNDMQAQLNIGKLYHHGGSSATPSNTSSLVYASEKTMLPSEVEDMTLTAYNETKYKGTISKTNGATKVVRADFDDWDNLTIDDFKEDYDFDKTDMVLKNHSSGEAIKFANGTKKDDIKNTDYSWGLRVETLLDNTTLATVKSRLSGGTITKENRWQVREKADTFYSWSTGLETWDKSSFLKKSDGSYMSFTQPWEISYTHSTANDRDGLSANDGKKFRLQFDGSRVDMPWIYDSDRDTWKPAFALKDGTELIYDDKTYIVKALEGEKMLNKVDSTYISNNNGTEPSINSANIGETGLDLNEVINTTFATKPTGELKVKVIKGVTQ